MDNRVFQVGASATPPTPPASPSNGYPTNGDPITSTPATQPGEFWFHQIGEELRAILSAAGVVPSTGNTGQVIEAIKRLIDAQSGNYALDTGAANAYVVALDPVITAYTNGMSVRVKAANANTGAAMLNAGGGVVNLVNDVGVPLVAGDIPAGVVLSATYIAANNHFRILSQVQSQDDARYQKNSTTVITDWDLVTTNGTYDSAPSATSHAPDTTSWWIGIVERHSAAPEVWSTQTVRGFAIDSENSGSVYRRQKNNGFWGTWYLVDLSKTEIQALNVASATNQSGGTVNATTGAFSGLMTLNGGQIKFPATQNASADAYTLDDYEEGTFTPAFSASTGSITINAGSSIGNYIKIGRMVSVSGLAIVLSVSSPTGVCRLTGLPFAVYYCDSAAAIAPNGLNAAAITSIAGYAEVGASNLIISQYAAGVLSNMAGNVQAASSFRFSSTYLTSN